MRVSNITRTAFIVKTLYRIFRSFTSPLMFGVRGWERVFVITIQATPRSLLTNCIPQGPFFFTTKTNPTFGATKYENLTKINLNYAMSGKHPVLDYVFFQLDFCSKLLFRLFGSTEPKWLLPKTEAHTLDPTESNLEVVTAKKCIAYKNQFNPRCSQKVEALQKSISIPSNLNKYS